MEWVNAGAFASHNPPDKRAVFQRANLEPVFDR